uniref:Uncharacterized protein n=1 Tax=Panagrolaimus sp. ES5 TaxID=591445 RepID=A0AC34GC20_9BILA
MAKKDDVEKGIQKPLFEDYNELIGRRRILPDCELDEFIPEFKDADVGYDIVRDSLKKDMDQMKDKVDVDVKNDLSMQEQQHDNNLVASSILSKLCKTLDSKIEKSQNSMMDKDITKSTCDNDQIGALITEFDSLHIRPSVKNKNQDRVLQIVAKTNISSPKTFKPNPPSTTPKAIKKTTPPPHESESDECEYTDDDENDVIANTKHSVSENVPSKIKHVNQSLSKSNTLPMLPEPRGIFKTLFDPSQMSDLSDVEDSEESEKCKNQARVLHVVAKTNDRSSKAFKPYPLSTTLKAINHIPTPTLDESESGECEYSDDENEIFVKTKNFIINNVSSTIEPVNQSLSHSTTLPRPVEPCVT